ncbi:hypothetical protein NRIC_06930 [Enterococcus florum]|uniref:Uncharacterized protein n=1 Tax=Enterococcus florum TaxID=2480627 RepID=A0A4P5PBI5_9ENTE|nr:hypothetical protein NRIC_06930 [Enterococcus florum]
MDSYTIDLVHEEGMTNKIQAFLCASFFVTIAEENMRDDVYERIKGNKSNKNIWG